MTAVTIVVPCFNEAERLPSQKFLDFVSGESSPRLLFVDDGSTDETASVLESLHNQNPRKIEILSLDQNSGKGEAVRQGLLHACTRSGDAAADYVGFWDADLATPLAAVSEFSLILDTKPQMQAIFGSRVKLLGRSIHRKMVRHYFGRVFATVVSMILRLPIYDSQCGAKLFRNTVELREILEEPFLSRWIFDVELIARYKLKRRGTERAQVADIIYELALKEWRDVGGSKIKPFDLVVVASDLCRIQIHYFMK